MISVGLGMFAAEALVPEHIPVYVRAVSGRSPLACASCIAYSDERDLVLIGYPLHDPHDSNALDAAVEQAVEQALGMLPAGDRLTVISAGPPSLAGFEATTRKDDWWFLDLPPPLPGQKTRNMLRRAGREVDISRASGVFNAEHRALVQAHARARPVDPGMLGIYSRLPRYLAASSSALLFSAYSRATNELVGCAIGEYGAFAVAFYLFAFRAAHAPPGTADLLLDAVLREAVERGHRRCNLGLGINAGIGFFKHKAGGRPLLPYREYVRAPGPARRSFWSR